jgi:Tfp pilus assembly protein PilP
MKSILLPAAFLALAACNQGEDKGRKQTAQEVAKEMAALKMEPGQWEATNEILSATAPGLPDEALKQMVGQKTTVSNCVTPEQAARPSANFMAAQKNSNCTYQDFSMEGGRMTGTMTCSGGQVPGQMEMAMEGEYSPRSYDMNMDMNAKGMPGGMTMTIKARTTGRKVGECTPGAKAP